MAQNSDKAAARNLGDFGEDLVAQWYERAGYTILERNWRCFEGELDIIASKGRSIVVCEVKTRTSSSFIDPALAISRSKQAKVRTAAYRWRSDNAASGPMRFDAAFVVAGRLQVFEGAF